MQKEACRKETKCLGFLMSRINQASQEQAFFSTQKGMDARTLTRKGLAPVGIFNWKERAR